jgi:hypothetical protein
MIDKTYIPLIHSPAERRKLGSRCSDSAAVRALQTDEAQRLADDTAIIGHPVRVQILTMLSATQGQTCVCDLEAALGQAADDLASSAAAARGWADRLRASWPVVLLFRQARARRRDS